MTDAAEKITRDDLEARFRSLQDNIGEKAEEASSKIIPAVVVGGILFTLIVYLIGKRVGTKRSTVVEIRRI
ncbi:MAG: hypothetical protein IH940_07945 [Acidobacteria bacterium]|nr:hypothetical protein [Acidobacteriota bacterium]